MVSDSSRGSARRRLTVAAVAAAFTLLAACGSSASGGGRSPAGGTVFTPNDAGLVQGWNLTGSDREKVTIAKPDGTIVHQVTLPFEPQTAFPIGSGGVIYTSDSGTLALVNSSSGAVHTVKARDEDYLPNNNQLSSTPYAQRWVLLQPPTLSHALLLDVTTGKTFDFEAQLNGQGFVSNAVDSPDGSRVLFGDARKAVLLNPATSRAEHEFADNSFGGCFTSAGTAIVVEPSGQARRVVAYDPSSKKLRTLQERPRSDGPVNAVCAGSTVVVTAGSRAGIDLVPADGGKSRHLSAVPEDISRTRPASDGRHVLVGTGSDTHGAWYLLDVDAGTVSPLGPLDDATLVGGAVSQRYWVFAPAGSGPGALSAKLLGFDSNTGKVTTLNFPNGRVVTSATGNASADGRVRSFLGSTLAISSYVVDVATGSIHTFAHSAGVSPAGDRVIQAVPRGHLQITDLQSKVIATLPAQTGVWTAS